MAHFNEIQSFPCLCSMTIKFHSNSADMILSLWYGAASREKNLEPDENGNQTDEKFLLFLCSNHNVLFHCNQEHSGTTVPRCFDVTSRKQALECLVATEVAFLRMRVLIIRFPQHFQRITVMY